MDVSRAFGDLPRINSKKPIIEETAEEEEAPSVPPFLDEVGNWCLDADCSQNLNIISVSNQKALDRQHAAVRLAQHSRPMGRRGMINLLARRIVNWIPAIDVDAGARDTLHLTPSVDRVPSASGRRTKSRLSPAVRMLDDDAVVSTPPAGERLDHQSRHGGAMYVALDILRRRPDIAFGLAR